MTLLELAPFAAICAGLGVGCLLVGRPAWLRVAAIVLVLAGSAPLVLTRAPGLVERLAAQPLLALGLALAGAAVVAGAAALLAPRPWLIVVLALLASLRIPMIPSQPSPTNHLALLWLVIAAGLAAFAWRGLRGRWPAPRLGAVGWALAAFVMLSGLSLLWSSDVEQGAYTFVAFFVPFGALAAMIGSIEVPGRLPWALGPAQVALAVVFAAVALYQARTGQLFWNPDLIEGNARLSYFRANSLFWDASALGRFQALAIVTLVGALALGARRGLLGTAVISAVAFAGLALSYSRAGYLMLIFGLLLVAAWWRPRIAGPMLALAIIGVITAIVVSGGVGLERITSSRAGILEEGVAAFESAPLAGVGLGGFPSAHNLFLGVAAELGVVGLAALLVLAGAIALAVMRPARPELYRAVRAVFAIELLAIAAHSVIDAQLFDDGIAWALAAMLAVMAAPERSAAARGAAAGGAAADGPASPAAPAP